MKILYEGGKRHEFCDALAGIPIVAGTDGSGLELIRELELYPHPSRNGPCLQND